MAVPLERLALARSAVDRQAELRTDGRLLQELADSADARLVSVRGNELLISGHELKLLPVPSDIELAYLGKSAESGTLYFCNLEPIESAGEWLSLRSIATQLDDEQTGLAVNAVALAQWHQTHTHCPRCGTPTEVVQAGWVRRCPADSSDHFPRTDPAVIVALTDDRDRLLLARQTVWAANQYSVLAGFCEPGESAEAAVVREVLEESGIAVTDVSYLGSQPWPFPASLMLAFAARGDGVIRVDEVEIAEAAWYSRAELAAACEAQSVKLPPPASIAHRMIERWYGSELPADWLRS